MSDCLIIENNVVTGVKDDNICSVIIPNGVTGIGDRAFAGCSLLSSIHLPDSVTSIGEYAFSRCNTLTNISVDYRNLVYYTIDGVLINRKENMLIYYPCGKSEKEYNVPNGVTVIGDRAFSGCSLLSSIHLPNSVTSIGNSAFYGCSSLTNIHLPDSVTSIGNYAFYGCSSLTNISVETGNSVYLTIDGVLINKKESTLIWYPCKKQESEYTVLKGITSIEKSAFEGCSFLTCIHLPESVTRIGSRAFYGCKSLTKISVDFRNDTFCSINGVLVNRKEGVLIHYPSGKLEKEYAVPEGVQRIGEGAFSGCSFLNSIQLPDSVTSIGDYAFMYCSSLASVHLSENVISIGESAFCFSSIATICLPESVVTIGDNAFSCCLGLTNINLSESVTSIGNSAFEGCCDLTSIHLPKSVTKIGNDAFRGCSSLINISVDERNSVYFTIDGVLINKKESMLICYPCKKQESEYVVLDGVTSIGKSAFEGCSSLTCIHLPASVTSIGNSAFKKCKSLTKISVDFRNDTFCSINGVLVNRKEGVLIHYPSGKLDKKYAVPEGIVCIGKNAFYGSSFLNSVHLPECVLSIGDSAFDGCSTLSCIRPLDNVISIGVCAFANCSSLVSIQFSENLTWIGAFAFMGCSSLASIQFSKNLTRIGFWAFMGCSSLASYCDRESKMGLS